MSGPYVKLSEVIEDVNLRVYGRKDVEWSDPYPYLLALLVAELRMIRLQLGEGSVSVRTYKV